MIISADSTTLGMMPAPALSNRSGLKAGLHRNRKIAEAFDIYRSGPLALL
ncbi:hypothetical protein [Candidimonas sp. SYP-B2681]|nr:hypothetical protein [Candidimonas sp. SYP-B2681]